MIAMAAIDDFAQLFGAASTGVENIATGTQRVTDQTVKMEQKIMDTIDNSKEGLEAYGALTLVFQGITAFSLLYIAGKFSKRGES